MLKSILPALLLSVFFGIQVQPVWAASKQGRIEANPVFHQKEVVSKEKNLKKGKVRKHGWFSKLLKAPGKWLKKITGEIDRVKARKYLIIGGVLLLLAIVFFALSSVSVVFNFLGTAAVIGTAVFFILWLLAYTGA